jgi:hypothetical protein
VWDGNRYYRDLGIPFPYKPTRAEIRRAFRTGEHSARRVFCFKQLMNRDLRPEYDAMPLGVVFMDEFEWQRIKRRTMSEMAKRGMDTEDNDLVKKVFEALGVPVEDDTPEKSPEILDSAEEDVQDQDQPVRLPPFPYAYYVWKTRPVDSTDREVLALWQPLLIRALSDLGVRMRVSLGLMGKRLPHEWSTGQVGYRNVAYFNRETEPSPEVAAKVAAALHEHHRTT